MKNSSFSFIATLVALSFMFSFPEPVHAADGKPAVLNIHDKSENIITIKRPSHRDWRARYTAFRIADVNRDGTVDVEDVVQIVNKSLGRY